MAKLANRHVFVVGASGYGKSTAEVKELMDEARRGKSAIICIDPHVNSTAAMFFAHLCAENMQDRVLYDRLSDVDRVLKWDFLAPSRADNPLERNGENQTRCEQFGEILLRRRGKGTAADTPSIEEWLVVALNLYIHQRKRRPLEDLLYAFSFDHPTFHSMLDACTDQRTRYKLESTIEKGQTPYQAAERLIEGVCRSPAFQIRTRHFPAFNFARHLHNKGILIVEGGAGGVLSKDAMKTMMGAIVLKTFNFLRARKREHPHVTLSLDEATSAELIGEAGHEVAALAELRKYGLGMHIMIQYLDFPNTKIEAGVMTNCATRKYFNPEKPETASRLGADLGGTYDTSGTTTRYYKDGTIFRAPTTDTNRYADDLRNLDVGECYVRQKNQNKLVQITPLPDPFDLDQSLLPGVTNAYLQEIKQRSEYYSPDGQETSTTTASKGKKPDDATGLDLPTDQADADEDPTGLGLG